MKTITTIFTQKGIIDNKHILNTSLTKIDQSILNEIESEGVTLERLNEFTQSGLNIYKYYTQITIHGVFPTLNQNYLNGYKVLFQNKNLSIGVKWSGIDAAKKGRIYSYSNIAGWHTSHNSQEWLIFKQKVCNTAQEAVIVANKYKTELSQIDSSLFYGSMDAKVVRDAFGRIWAVAHICVNGILFKNVNTLIEQITNKTISEIETLRAAKAEQEKKEHAAFERDYAKRKAIREAEKNRIKEVKEHWAVNNPLDDFIRVQDNPIKSGQTYAYVTPDNETFKWAFQTFKKIGANLCAYESDINGNKLSGAAKTYSTKKSGYLKN